MKSTEFEKEINKAIKKVEKSISVFKNELWRIHGENYSNMENEKIISMVVS